MALRAVIFDLGGTLIDWPDWDEDIQRRWALSYDYLVEHAPLRSWPERGEYVRCMREAEAEHWQRVNTLHTSNSPAEVLCDGFTKLQCEVGSQELLFALDGYANAVIGWAFVFPDAVQTLLILRKRGLRLGLLSNTWWAAAWHDADLATHGLTSLLDVVVYTSDIPYSKPHAEAFYTVTRRLGVDASECVMVGDRLDADIIGAQGIGMRSIWKKTSYLWPAPAEAMPDAIITDLEELLPLIEQWDA
ncbi:HAD family hydrolase [Ktedonobacteria bacterium brp13]|nr:HAD family hydrolase [Ktedonobacteria bacterium brp13]